MTKVDCPVCGKTALADHLAQCPQCNADLECFRLLEALYEEQSTPGVEAEVVRSLSRRVEDIGLLLQRLQDSLHQVQQAAKRRTAMLIVVSVMLMLVSAASAWLLYVRWDTPPERADVMSSAALLAVLTRERPPEQALREAVPTLWPVSSTSANRSRPWSNVWQSLLPNHQPLTPKLRRLPHLHQSPLFWCMHRTRTSRSGVLPKRTISRACSILPYWRPIPV